jgi:general secretion pathway protein G
MSARKRIQGFTLVEILIVVVILGILAAIVIPQFSTASDAARASSTLSQLQTVRSQLELYKTQHKGSYPALADMWTNLIEASDVDGATNGTNQPDAAHPFGAYLQKEPLNPFMVSKTLAAAPADGVGWQYNELTGEIKMVLPATANPDALGLDATEYVVAPAP